MLLTASRHATCFKIGKDADGGKNEYTFIEPK